MGRVYHITYNEFKYFKCILIKYTIKLNDYYLQYMLFMYDIILYIICYFINVFIFSCL